VDSAPEDGRQLVARVRLADRQRQVSQERLRLPGRQRQRLARIEPGLKPAEEREGKTRHRYWAPDLTTVLTLTSIHP
jgi:hypothetical protein